MKELGNQWTGMPDSQKAKYFGLANEGKRHNPKFPKSQY